MERRLKAFLDMLGTSIYVFLALVVLVVTFTTFAAQQKALGQIAIPEPCAALARRIGLPPVLTREQRIQARGILQNAELLASIAGVVMTKTLRKEIAECRKVIS